MSNQKWTIQRKGQQDEKKNTTQHNMCRTPLYTKNTNDVNKTGTLLQTTGGKDEPSIVFMQKL